MQSIIYKPNGMFFSFYAAQSDGLLSSQLAHAGEIEGIDVKGGNDADRRARDGRDDHATPAFGRQIELHDRRDALCWFIH